MGYDRSNYEKVRNVSFPYGLYIYYSGEIEANRSDGKHIWRGRLPGGAKQMYEDDAEARALVAQKAEEGDLLFQLMWSKYCEFKLKNT